MPEPADAPVRVILNAAAGSRASDEWMQDVDRKFRERGMGVRIEWADTGERILAAAEQAVAQGARIVVACGGDGTVNAVACRLAGTDVALGVLPMGTLNHFAKDLGIPLDLDAAIEVIGKRHLIAVDVGEVNGRLFINNSSLGLYPEIVVDREQQRRRLGRGKWRALAAACVHALRRYPVLSLHIELDGKGYDRRSAFAFIGNNEYAMEGFNIGERACLWAGQLSLYVTQRTGRFGLLRLALRALAGRLRQARDFDMVTTRSLVVRTPHKRIRVATDGEVSLMETPLNYRIRPGALRVIVPQPAQAT